jgi:hypothetical protein
MQASAETEIPKSIATEQAACIEAPLATTLSTITTFDIFETLFGTSAIKE